MRALLRVSRVIDAITDRLGAFIGVLVGLLILVGVYNVVTRYIGYFFRRAFASNAVLDLQWQLFSLIFFSGLFRTSSSATKTCASTFCTAHGAPSDRRW